MLKTKTTLKTVNKYKKKKKKWQNSELNEWNDDIAF